jgi:O-glycosyl hydrolase
MRSSTALWLVSAALLVVGCGGSSSTNGSNPPPPIAPTITAVTPPNASTGVAVSSAVTATFSTAMNASTITSSTFTFATQGGSAVTGTVSYASASLTATFTPGAPLANNTTYTATITTGATNSAGTALASNYSWSFTTAAAPAPTVTAVTPVNASTGVALNSTITATFSTSMSSSTITSSTFTLVAQGGSAITGTVSYNSGNNIATFTPTGPIANSTMYTATITTGATSSAGTALAANYTWSFTTVAAVVPAPTVTAVTPANVSTGVAVAAPVTATFSTAMSATSITGSTFTLVAQGGSSVQGIVSYNPATFVATFSPVANLAYNTIYNATITTMAISSAGTALAANFSWSFTTAAAPAPTVTSTVPANNTVNVSVNEALTATFSQPMNSSTITAGTFTLTGPGNTAVAGILTYNSGTSTATFTPSSALAYSTTYMATITTGATSSAGAALASNFVWSFTTGSNPNQVAVNFGTTYQTIRGFGGSTAWLGQMSPAVSTALFGANGLNLSILRVRIDPEGSPTGGGASGDPYETSEWDYEAANGKAAVAANPNAIVFATPWTPPANWKLNGTTTTVSGTSYNETFNSCAEGNGYCGGYLDPNHYADYANYLEDFVNFFNKTNGFNLYAISMQNEPEENVTYESCVWTPQQMDTWVAGSASTITSDPYSTKLIMPESDTFNPVDAATALGDPNAESLISIIGGHIYQVSSGASIQPYPALPAGDSPKELWMTEFGPLSEATPTFNEALTTYAESIHNSLVTGQYNAYVWWGIFGTPTAAGTWGLVDDGGNPTVMGEVMGQYSKFIQPGYVRAEANASPVAGVYISAYTGDGHFVIVAINSNATSQNLSFALSGGTVTSLTPYQSTSAAGLVSQSAVSVSNGEFNYTLPAQSIVSFVQ